MQILCDTSSTESYRTFLKVKSLPSYRIIGRTMEFPDEYAASLGLSVETPQLREYQPIEGLFDYQVDITRRAIEKRKYCVFADCGLGKTLIFLEFARHVLSELQDKIVMIVSPLMVIPQTMQEASAFYGDYLPIEVVPASGLSDRIRGPGGIIVTNYEALRDDTPQGNLGCLILDESSMLKSMYGRWGQTCLRLGAGLNWKMACTGTPAPNDRIEYANHAVFMDAFPNPNSFLAKFFVNRGQTDERWELKKHAIGPFYRALSHWSIFLTNPANYGWSDNVTTSIPPIHVHIHQVPITDQQQQLVFGKTGTLYADQIGGIKSRSVMGQIAKGNHRGEAIETLKPTYIRSLVDSWPDESTIIWCIYNAEQETMEQTFPEAHSMSGDTPDDIRQGMIADFKSGRVKVLISKAKILGFGLNLQIATRQVFSGLQDSYESYYQCVKRSNRIGSTRPLNVHIPVTDIERPMIDTVLKKAKRVQQDTEEQEAIFRSFRHV